ncbi:hypothetical protein JCM10207_001867 [Rhodosporidiobolus poonsookiae]
MSISAPLPYTALSSHPLDVLLSLDSVPAPPPSTRADDVFNSLDDQCGSWTVHTDYAERPSADSSGAEPPADASSSSTSSSTFPSALSDSSSLLFPGVSIADEAALASAQAASAGVEAELPAWLKATSGRVTALASGRIQRSQPGAGGKYAERTGGGRQKRQSSIRVAAGCEDGTVWVFAPPPSNDASLSPSFDGFPGFVPSSSSTSGEDSARRLSHDSLFAPNSGSSSTPTSPPTSPSARSRRKFSSTTPQLSSRRSSTSISTIASNATTRTPRNASASSTAPSLSSTSGAAGLSYEVLRSASRPRKASATVSISTSSAIPSSSHGPHSELPDLPPMPSSPPLRSPSTASSPPISPTIPHFVFSSPPPGTAPPAQSALGSRKEAPWSPLDGPASVPLQKRSHSRAKESIASGIGLWETEGAAASRSSLSSPGLGEDGEQYRQVVLEQDEVEQVGEDKLEKLVPVLKVRTEGWGEVVALRTTGSLIAAEDEGDVLLVLRASGHLSVVSFRDGRAFGSCDVARRVATSNVSFSSLDVVEINSVTYALCSATSGADSIVPVRLDTLIPQDPLDGLQGSAGAVVLVEHGSAVLVQPSPPADADTPCSVVVHPLRSVESASKGAAHPALHLLRSEVVLPLPGFTGEIKRLQRCGKHLLASDGASLVLLSANAEHLAPLAQLDSNAGVVCFIADSDGRHVAVGLKGMTKVYELKRQNLEDESYSFELVAEQPSAGVELLAFLSSARDRPSVLIARSGDGGERSLELLNLPTSPEKQEATQTVSLYCSTALGDAPRPTRVKLLDNDQVLLGYCSGAISIVPLAELASVSSLPPARAELVGAITLLDTLELGGRQVVIAGSASGMAGAWNLNDWDPIGSWTLFASPVAYYANLDPFPSSSSRLGNTLAFISANSPVALVSLFPPALLFVLPGTKSAVERIATTRDQIMVLYEQGLARTCDIASRELRRSMERKTAEGVLSDGSWTIWFDLTDARKSTSPAAPTDPLLDLDLRSFLDQAVRQLPWSASRSAKKRDSPEDSPDPARNGARTPSDAEMDGKATARALVGALATFGVDAGADELLEQLDVKPAAVPLLSALQSETAISLPANKARIAPWTIFPEATAQRLLRLICLLRLFLNYPDTERTASELIVYYASCLADSVGPSFASPSLDVFARFWLDKNGEIQQATRSLFGTYLAATPDDEVLAFAERWQDSLPARQKGLGLLHHQADHALLVVGLVAIERFKLLSSSVLKDVSVSIAAYLEEHEHPYHQAVATELCSRGFGIWQNYVDAMSLVRQLFAIAIGRNPSTPNDLRLLARNATLHVAGVNTPLFMTTLVNDILNAPSAPSRNATLKLLGFMIRKKPLVLYTSLPRVADAVVKSLDPTVSALRETVHQSATVILNELVRTFPSIDFHGKSQRLVVGTQEGAAIVYDLRTATRLYVLEGHKRPVTALSFSPDGHRLVTVSLAESRVAAWKVGGGFLSMFTAGAPPRQGGGSSETPFKTYDFHVGDEALMTTAATLEWVVFDWPAERTVRLRLRETALNFGV